MSALGGPGPHTRLRRLPEKANYDVDTIWAIFDEAPYVHVATLQNDLAMALPTLAVREGETLYLHSSLSSATMAAVVTAGRAFITATLYDGIRLARSGFESSIAFRSVALVGTTRVVEDVAEKERILQSVIDGVLPGRSREVRPLTAREVALTRVVAVDVTEASAKISAGPTSDSDDDSALPIWAGTLPARVVYDAPIATMTGAMESGDVPLPDSVRAWLNQHA